MEKTPDLTKFKQEYNFKKLNKQFKITFSINDTHESIYISMEDVIESIWVDKKLKLKEFLEKDFFEKDYGFNGLIDYIEDSLLIQNEHPWPKNVFTEFDYFLRESIKKVHNELNFIFKRE